MDEADYLLGGELEALDGERTFTADAGPVFTFPRDAVRLEEYNDESSYYFPHRRPLEISEDRAEVRDRIPVTSLPIRPGGI